MANKNKQKIVSLTYKIVVVGSGGSALTQQFILDQFFEGYDPTIEDAYRKIVTLDNYEVQIEIVVTAGMENFSAMRDLYFHSGDGFLCVFSITDLVSFSACDQFREQIILVKGDDNIPFLLVGNKTDFDSNRRVTMEDAQRLAHTWKVPYVETSAKTRSNVDKVFFDLIREIHKQKQVMVQKKLEEQRKRNVLFRNLDFEIFESYYSPI